MARIRLPILKLSVSEQVYSCHGCGNCCRDFTVQVRAEDLEKLNKQNWEGILGFPPVVQFRGETYLRQREDGSCVFLMENGLCRIHAEHGYTEKPIACQVFPFHLTPEARGVRMGINFACQSVLENKGAALDTHLKDVQRMAQQLPEIEPTGREPMLTPALRASIAEVQAIESRVDAWLQRGDVSLSDRLEGVAFIAQSLAKATLANVREKRFAELLDILFSALPAELTASPVSPPSRGQMRLLRQATFARIEDPKIGRVEKRGKAGTALSQFLRSRRFASGRGTVSHIGEGWGEAIPLADVERIERARDREHARAIDDLLTRWLRATILGGRAWGAGYYNWSVVNGVQALALNIAVIGWLARLQAVGRSAGERHEPLAMSHEGAELQLTIADIRAALSRVDRTAGRAKWLGTRAELWRLRYFNADDGLRRLVRSQGVAEGDGG